MKKILGLDLGITSIGWAFVKESDNNEQSTIEKIGVRIINYGDNLVKVDKMGKVTASLEPEKDFQSGKGLSPNAGRTKQRGARRNLQRFKQRRENLIEVLKNNGFIKDDSILAENDKNSTHSTFALRSEAAENTIGKDEFARVLLMLNKKRGYKSSRKAKNEDEGQVIDGMAIAKKLYEEELTPGQLSYQLLKSGKKYLPDFYRSDLKSEFEKIWTFQNQFYPEILTPELKKELEGNGGKATAVIFWKKYNFNTAENKGTRDEKKLQGYKWRSIATSEQLAKEEVAYVIAEVNNNLNNSSGYLGAISDRSKELYFNNKTIGQYLYAQLKDNSHSRMKNQVFYRQDYMDEFERIWETQAKGHPELTSDLKIEIRDVIIFYQRKLKSQKGLINFCEFESKQIETLVEGQKKTKTIGAKVIPKSSPLFQEFKIWQNLNDIQILNKKNKEKLWLNNETKQMLFEELNLRGSLTKTQVLKLIVDNPNQWDLNFLIVEGNRTNQVLYEAFFRMIELKEQDEIEIEKFSGEERKTTIKSFLDSSGIDSSILDFSAELDGKEFEKQPCYQFWHLLYSYEGDNTKTGNEHLWKLLETKFGFQEEYAKLLASISFQQDYGSLSAKAIRKIFPFLKENKFHEACALAGYNHSSSLTKEENENRTLKSKLELLPKNSLRNPIVEKILNQMVNVINAVIADPALGKPDEIRIELARELKKNAKEREAMTEQINASKANHDNIRMLLISEFGIKNPTRNDIVRYKLYDELKVNGFKTIYCNTYIPREKLFSKEFDIEHIIPKARLFDDSFSNKTLSVRQFNLDKGDETGYDYINKTFGTEKLAEYISRVEICYNSKESPISKSKYKKLLMKGSEIGEGFIERDLRESQYIAKKAKQMLEEVCRYVTTTTGSITDRLREDWDLINVMQELNFDKYKKLGLTEKVEKKDGGFKERITDWTKRNDHRHHAMDALTVAFTKRSHVKYLNNLNARSDKAGSIYGIEQKETYRHSDGKRKFKSPLKNFREEAKFHLENVLISIKAKNKVVTKNKNKTAIKNGDKIKIELTPRGQLHKETVYGKAKQYKTKEEKISAKFDQETILTVAKLEYRNALLKRLLENENDPKKAFGGKNSLINNPIFLDEQNTKPVPEKVKLVWLENDYTIRKNITPDLKVDKVLDPRIRVILQNRLDEFNGNAKEAFNNLDKNPIWLNKEKGIVVKRVTISGVKNVEALHFKKDHLGRYILDKEGKRIPVDFVSTGNNHHVAIYRDDEGVLQERIISFYEAVQRVNEGLHVIDKSYNQNIGWQFLFTMKQNEYFVFPSNDFDPSEIDLMNTANNKLISPNLFRVQTISVVQYGSATIRDFKFRHHLETSVEDRKELKDISFKQIKSLLPLEKIIKVRVNHIGEIVKVGEY